MAGTVMRDRRTGCRAGMPILTSVRPKPGMIYNIFVRTMPLFMHVP